MSDPTVRPICEVCERPMAYGPDGWQCGWAGCARSGICTETALARVVIELRPTSGGKNEIYAYLWHHDAFTPHERPRLAAKLLGDAGDILRAVTHAAAVRAAARN